MSEGGWATGLGGGGVVGCGGDIPRRLGRVVRGASGGEWREETMGATRRAQRGANGAQPSNQPATTVRKKKRTADEENGLGGPPGRTPAQPSSLPVGEPRGQGWWRCAATDWQTGGASWRGRGVPRTRAPGWRRPPSDGALGVGERPPGPPPTGGGWRRNGAARWWGGARGLAVRQRSRHVFFGGGWGQMGM